MNIGIIDELEELAIGARMKRLYEMFSKDVTLIYKDQQLEFEPKYFTLYYLLSREGETSITDLADKLNLTHPGVIHLAGELEKLGYIESFKSAKDSRKRMLRLSKKGKESLAKFDEVWVKIKRLNKELFESQQYNLLTAIKETEALLASQPYYERFQAMFSPVAESEIQILDYRPELSKYFKGLNIEWINTHFTVEQHDLEQLNHPEEHILNDGGAILFAKLGSEIAATCALVKTGEAEYELAKMAVSPRFRGRKIGERILLATVDKARQLNAKRVWLESNTKLVPAINLYKKSGFIEIPIDASPYARADIRMEIHL
ncbi:GNAT family N-acetyltransferase [Mucilaginibacter sp. AW1-3]